MKFYSVLSWFPKMHRDSRPHTHTAVLHVFTSFNQIESISTQFLQSSFRHGSLDADHQCSSCFRIVHSLLYIEYIVCVTLLAFFSIYCPCIAYEMSIYLILSDMKMVGSNRYFYLTSTVADAYLFSCRRHYSYPAFCFLPMCLLWFYSMAWHIAKSLCIFISLFHSFSIWIIWSVLVHVVLHFDQYHILTCALFARF